MAFHRQPFWAPWLLSVTAALLSPVALAQYSQGGAGPSSSGSGMGSGMGMGQGMGQDPSPGTTGAGPAAMQRWGDGITPGWSLMTPAERMEHQLRMRSMTSYDECKSYMAQHQAQMNERANQQGTAPMVQPRQDVCQGMPP